MTYVLSGVRSVKAKVVPIETVTGIQHCALLVHGPRVIHQTEGEYFCLNNDLNIFLGPVFKVITIN